MSSSKDRTASFISVILFRVGQLFLLVGYLCFKIGMATNYWVVRPPIDYSQRNVDPKQVDVVKHFGIFRACKQSEDDKGESGECGSMTDLIHFVDNGAIVFVQALMVIASILYLAGFVLDMLQLMPIKNFRNFLAENRLVEMLSGIATVTALTAMVIYAGEVKNKAELVPGQEDESVGWSFSMAITGLSLCIIGLLVITMFRHLPVPRGPGSASQPAKGGSWLRIKDSGSNSNSSSTRNAGLY